jgi:3-dehydroquinate synthase
VTGDLAGFAAATWQRGVPVVQVPTSLLAMADAALGGKTAVDLPGAKNLVGAFHQPWGIYADVDVLTTLPEDDYRDGFAEIVKVAVIADLAFFRWLEGAVEPLLRREAGALVHAVTECMRIKARVVRRDERESGRRAVLNFGHTVAHAVEAESGWSVRHGPAVAQGMCAEARMARARLGFPESHLRRLLALLEAFGLPVTLQPGAGDEALIAATRHDKKARAGRVRYALPRRIGRMLPGDEVTLELDDAAVAEALAASR